MSEPGIAFPICLRRFRDMFEPPVVGNQYQPSIFGQPGFLSELPARELSQSQAREIVVALVAERILELDDLPGGGAIGRIRPTMPTRAKDPRLTSVYKLMVYEDWTTKAVFLRGHTDPNGKRVAALPVTSPDPALTNPYYDQKREPPWPWYFGSAP